LITQTSNIIDHSIRLKDYDYSQAGAYFVTICAWQRECLFGEIVDGEMVLNDVGRIVETVWCHLPEQFNRTRPWTSM
jgi:putative transposase